jgi:predicted GNAT family acetyltransferase
VFVHTEVEDKFEGHGVGGALARGALDDVRARGFKVTPLCPFIAGWMKKHPEYEDLHV